MRDSKRCKRAAALGLAVGTAALAMMSPSALAGNTWDGGGGDSNWETAANWDSDTSPGYGTLSFQGSTRTSNQFNFDWNMNQVFWNGSSNWTMTGIPFTALYLYDFGGTQAKLESAGSGGVTIDANVTFAANNGSPPNPFGEINAVGSDITFSAGKILTVNGSSVNGIKFWGGAGKVVTFNNTVTAGGKWFATTGSAAVRVASGANVTVGSFYAINDGKLDYAGGSFTGAIRLGGELNSTGNVDLTKGGTLAFSAPAGGLSLGSSIVADSANTSGNLLIDSQNTSGTNTITSAGLLDLQKSLKIQQAAGGTLQIDAVVQGAGSLTKLGAGTLTLNATNTYTGGTNISAGAIALGVLATQPLGTGSVTVNSGARLDLERNTMANALTLSGGSLRTGNSFQSEWNGPITLTASTSSTIDLRNNGRMLLAGAISGAGSLTIQNVGPGNGGLTISGANTYSGGTTLDTVDPYDSDISGLQYNNTSAFGTGAVTFANNSTVRSGVSGTVANNIAISSGTFATFDTQGYDAVLSGAISGSGAIIKNGHGTLTLSGANTYTNGTYLLYGVLQVSSDDNLGNVSGILSFSGGSLRAGASFTISAARPVELHSGDGNEGMIDTNGFNVDFAASSTNDGLLEKTGAGTLTLSGLNNHMILVADAGTIALGHDRNDDIDALNGGTIDIGAHNQTVESLRLNSGTVTGTSGVLQQGGSQVYEGTISAILAGAGAVEKFGAGTVVLTRMNTYTGGTTVTNGELKIGDNGTSGSIIGDIVNNAFLTFNRSDNITYAGNVSGLGTLSHKGSGDLTLSGSLHYDRLDMSSPGTLYLTGNNTSAGPTVINIGVVEFSTLSNLGTGKVVMHQGTLRWAPGSTADVSELGIEFSETGSYDTNGNDVTLANPIGQNTSTSADGGLIKIGAGTLTLAAAEDYIGATTINAGTLQIGNGGTEGSLRTNSTITNNANLAFNRSDTVTQGTDFSGDAISGTGSLTQLGSGTLVLTAANTYTGGTIVNNGMLQLGNGVDAAALVGNSPSGATAGGDAVTVNNASTLTVLTNASITGGHGGSGPDSGNNAIILAGGNGITVNDGSSVQNAGTITGGDGGNSNHEGGNGGHGIAFIDGGFLINTGSIVAGLGFRNDLSGIDGRAVDFSNGGSLTNSGTISSAIDSVYPVTAVAFAGAAGTLVNQTGGVIDGVSMGSFANHVTLETGSTINGDLNIGTSTSATLTLTGTGSQVYSAAVTGATTFSGALTKSDSGTWILDQTFTYTGGTTISAGTLQIGDGGNSGTILGNVTNNGELVFNRSDNIAYSGSISGSGSVTKRGAGILIFNASHSYTGQTVIEAGTLRLNSGWSPLNPRALSSLSSVYIDAGGTLLLGTGDLWGLVVNTSAPPIAINAGGSLVTGAGTYNTLGNILFLGGTITANGGHDSEFPSLGLNGQVTVSGSQASQINPGTGSDIGINLNIFGSTTFAVADVTSNSDADLTVNVPLVNSGGLTKTGDGTLVLTAANTYPGATTVSGGKLALAQSLTTSSSITVENNATLELSTGANAVLKTPTVSIAGTGKIDLTDNDMIVTGMSYSAVESLVKSGFGNFDWLGTGITSSTAASFAQVDGSRAVGVIDNADWGYGEFSGQTVNATDILVKFTWVADSNLDGLVDNDDFGQFLYGFNGGGSARWLNGDFDYSGFVDNDDFGWFLVGLGAFQASGNMQLSEDFKSQLAQFASANGLPLTLAVPEPALAAIAGVLLAFRRPRRSR